MRIDIKGLDKLKSSADGARKASSIIKELLNKEAARFANKSVTTIRQSYLSGPRPEKLGVVTGRLRSSIRYSIQEASDSVTVRLGSDIIYAATHEFGDEARGIRKRSFLRPGTEDELPEFKDRIQELLARVAGEGIGGK